VFASEFIRRMIRESPRSGRRQGLWLARVTRTGQFSFDRSFRDCCEHVCRLETSFRDVDIHRNRIL